MKSLKSALYLLVTITTVLVLTAFDAAAKTQVQVQETYPATDGPSTPEELPETPSGAPLEVTSSVQVKTEIATPKKSSKKSTKKDIAQNEPSQKKQLGPHQKLVTYDSVPQTQSEAVLARLKIVADIIRVYGRAYDYRVYTLAELQEIQNHLQSSTLPPPVEQTIREMNPEERTE